MDTEILVVGAGVFGLSIARALASRGHTVLVAERDSVGAGASATPLGVLSPHTPDRWNEKKAAQFEALTTLPKYIAALEAETGLSCGYRQCGRLIPLESDHIRQLWKSRCGDAKSNWQGEASIELLEADERWVAADHAPFGVARCGLSARIDARAYLMALAASIGEHRILCGYALSHIEGSVACFNNGESITARRIVLANGTDAFRFLPDLPDGSPVGRGEKGQAAILRLPPSAFEILPDVFPELPIIFSNRLYVVPRGPDTVAVGATSERFFDEPSSTDEQLGELIDRARILCPPLRNAQVIERWARLRPRSADRKVLLAPLPENPSVVAATGGFKTGLAMAHRVAQTLADQISDQ